MYVCMYVCMYACMYVCMYVCMYIIIIIIRSHFASSSNQQSSSSSPHRRFPRGQHVPSVCLLSTSAGKQRSRAVGASRDHGQVRGPREGTQGHASEILRRLEEAGRDQAPAPARACSPRQPLGPNGKAQRFQEKVRVLQQDSQARQGRQEGLRWASFLIN